MPDAAQLAAARRLQRLYDELVAFKAARRNALRKLLVHPELPRGVWFWGGVGRGKTFLMDCFHETVPYRRKRRVHFHAFMREVHERLRSLKGEADPLARVAQRFGEETRLMCFDEFHVADVADAMILARLMPALFDAGVIFCITANEPPDGLYRDGLQRELFLPTVALLQERLDVVRLDAGIDYRLRALAEAETQLVPASPENEARLERLFRQLAGGGGHARPIEVLGRGLQPLRRVPGIVWFDFATLCGGPRSQNDYLELARRFHTVLLSGVPRMTAERASEARRFIWLVDVLHDCRVKLALTAEAPAGELCSAGPLAGEFGRTASRLAEMRSRDYLESAHRPPGV